MKTFQIITLFALVASAMAFAPNQISKVVSEFSVEKAAIGALPVAFLASPAFALDSVIEALPTNTIAMQVQFGAYLAVLFGTFLPVLFLINLFIQTESRKAGRDGGIDAE
eukprot:CAMPEP_0197836552 /NCGR_PEP_ID=MMETSP1437-20131217/29355_1 /TAXON_ID=49252 ORGANISM="Eucampia antarctica, Strain CCMP1452" /NCGR_SAMPLE_ID=MMETSP1437 /ASSEMBLY_ACC=CAM_ASM_001096 /LENGTH=109 /DNA_ID=CAMNT_0043442823 /DNA_START=40 /DNA_END=369 /DNA_ORIENTATION=+